MKGVRPESFSPEVFEKTLRLLFVQRTALYEQRKMFGKKFAGPVPSVPDPRHYIPSSHFPLYPVLAMSCRFIATELSDQVVQSSGPKLTVSMFCLCIFSSTVSTDGRSRSSRGLRWRSWTALGAYVGSLGPLLGPMLAVLGCS